MQFYLELSVLHNESDFCFICSFRTPKPKDAKFVEEEDDYLLKAEGEDATEGKEVVFRAKIQWANVAVNLFIHFGSLVGFYQMFTLQPKWQTYLFCEYIHHCLKIISVLIFPFPWHSYIVVVVTALCNLSVCIGVHRLWSHRSFKCVRGLKLVLLFFYTMAGQVRFLILKKSERKEKF
jgi:hypothetical protein